LARALGDTDMDSFLDEDRDRFSSWFPSKAGSRTMAGEAEGSEVAAETEGVLALITGFISI